MKKLFVNLPALAGDYSGVCAVFFEMNCLKMVHGAGGCVGNFCHCDELRWQPGTKNIYNTDICEIEAITGDDDIMIQKVIDAYHDLDCKFVLVCGSPITMLIGTDLTAIGKTLEKELGCPVITVNTTGTRRYDLGQQWAYEKLVDTFIIPEKQKWDERQVNLIGVTPIDGWDEQIVASMEDYLRERGYDKIQCWGMHTDVDEIKKASGAALNIAVDVSALSTVERLNQLYGTPYEVGIPIGCNDYEHFAEKCKSISKKKKVLIVAEQFFANSVRNFLEKMDVAEQVDVASFFMMNEIYARERDEHVDCEEDLDLYIEKYGPFDVVIGDAFISKFFDQGQKYIRIPHPAVSAHNNTPDFDEDAYYPYMITVVGEWNTPRLADLIHREGAEWLLDQFEYE